jgi:hypothetical protein
MTDPAIALDAIQQYVSLAVERRVGQLPPELREEMDALEEILRDVIAGARPKPKKIEGSLQKDAEKAKEAAKPAAPAKGEDLKLSGLTERLNMTLEDQKKVREVKASALPASTYTPAKTPLFMGDYYDNDVVLGMALPKIAPKSVVRADGQDIELMEEVKVMFGLSAPPPEAEPEETTEAKAAPRATSGSSDPLGRPTIVHFVSGGTKRGVIAPFDAADGQVVFLSNDPQKPAEVVSLDNVLAIFFGLMKGEEATPVTGEKVVVTLINDKRLAGLTPDYQEGGESLTIIPEPRRGNIDRIWVPASAVKAIEM